MLCSILSRHLVEPCVVLFLELLGTKLNDAYCCLIIYPGHVVANGYISAILDPYVYKRKQHGTDASQVGWIVQLKHSSSLKISGCNQLLLFSTEGTCRNLHIKLRDCVL